jgi:hypothetical protein
MSPAHRCNWRCYPGYCIEPYGRTAVSESQPLHSPLEPFPRIQVPDEVAERLTYFAAFAADAEAMKYRPASRVRGPDGEIQSETQHEFVRRIVTAGVLHLVEIGLLAVPEDFDARLDDYLPMSREDGRAENFPGG